MPDDPEESPPLTILIVEPAAAAAVASAQDAPELNDLFTDWLGSDDPESLLLDRLVDESLPAPVRCLATFLLMIELADRGRTAVLSDIERWAPSLAGPGLIHIVKLNTVAVVALLTDMDMWSSRPTAPVSVLLDRVENDGYASVGGMCALAAAMTGIEDVVMPVLRRQLRIALRPDRAAGAALGLALCGTAERVLDDLRGGARTDPDETVRSACYLGMVLLDGDISEGLFDVHPQVRGLVSLLLMPPLSARQRGRLLRVVKDDKAAVEERIVAAGKLLDEEDNDDLLPPIVSFLSTSKAPEVAPVVEALLTTDVVPPVLRKVLAAAIRPSTAEA